MRLLENAEAQQGISEEYLRMSGGKASEKQTEDTSAPDHDLRAPRHTRRHANALKDDMSILNKQPGGKSHNLKGKKPAEQRKKARTTPAEKANE